MKISLSKIEIHQALEAFINDRVNVGSRVKVSFDKARFVYVDRFERFDRIESLDDIEIREEDCMGSSYG